MCKRAVDQFPSADDWRDLILDNDDVMWGPDEDEPPPPPTKEALESALAKLDADRDDVMDMRRTGLMTQEKAKERLAQLNREELRLKRQLDNLAHKEESDRKLLALIEREVAQLDALKARIDRRRRRHEARHYQEALDRGNG